MRLSDNVQQLKQRNPGLLPNALHRKGLGAGTVLMCVVGKEVYARTEEDDSFVRMQVFVPLLLLRSRSLKNACFSTQTFSYRSDFNTMMEYELGRCVVWGNPINY